MLSVSAIVPVHYGSEAFCKCLSSLAEATPPPDEIIVVADGETDGAWRQARMYGARVLKHDVARGPAYARNQGALAASGDVLFFVDADVVIRPDTVVRIRETLERDPSLSALIGSYDDAPAHEGFLSQYRNLLHHFTHQTACEEASTFWGACGAIRRETFLALGGFDEAYQRSCIEDIDLGYRLKQAGYRIRLCKEIQVKHLKKWSAASMVKTDIFHRALPWTELMFKHRKFRKDLNLRTENRFSVVAVFVLLGALLAAFWYPPFYLLGGVMAALLMVLNASFYRFLLHERGLLFCLGALPWHWLYYGYSGLGFVLGVVRYMHRSLGDESYQPTPLTVAVETPSYE